MDEKQLLYVLIAIAALNLVITVMSKSEEGFKSLRIQETKAPKK